MRRQLKERHGGAADARLFCVVTTRSDEQGRFYRLPNERDLEAVRKAAKELAKRAKAHHGSLPLIPQEKLDMRGIRHTWVMIYGIDAWGDLFSPRQALALSTLCRLVRKAGEQAAAEQNGGLAAAVQTCLALCLDRVADLANSLCGWKLDVQCPTHLFARQAVPMVWDFSESVCLSASSGSWTVMTERFADILSIIGNNWGVGEIANVIRHRTSATRSFGACCSLRTRPTTTRCHTLISPTSFTSGCGAACRAFMRNYFGRSKFQRMRKLSLIDLMNSARQQRTSLSMSAS